MHWLVVLLQVCLWRAVFSVVRVLRPGLPAATGSRCTGSIREERRHLCCESTKESFALICSAVLSMDFALLGFFLAFPTEYIDSFPICFFSLLFPSLFPDRRKDSSYPGHGRQNVSV